MAKAPLAGAGDGASSCAETPAAKTASATKTAAMLTLAIDGDGGGCDVGGGCDGGG